MSVDDLDGYVRRMRERYRQASRSEKGRVLDEFCAVLRCHRKSAIRSLRKPPETAVRRSGRPRVYGKAVLAALEVVWEASDFACGKRLAPQLPFLVGALERHRELQLTAEVRTQLLALSASTIDRQLAPVRRRIGRRPYHQSPALSAIQRQVPIRTFGEWADVAPGQVQADLVSHCGVNPSGSFVVTLTMVDVATGWTECRAALTKAKAHVRGAVHVARRNLPVPLTNLHSDNGGEFLNEALFAYCREERIAFTRGRPYQKNDQAYVEQKNGAVVRRYVGYQRYQSAQARDGLNQLYELLRLYLNFFQPVRKLIHKERFGARVVKRYDAAATPYQRLLAAGVLDRTTQSQLERKYLALNPVRLRSAIAASTRALGALAAPHWGADAVPITAPKHRSQPNDSGRGGKVDSLPRELAGADRLPTFPPHGDGRPTKQAAISVTGFEASTRNFGNRDL